MLFHQRFVPGLAIASYVVGDEQSGEAIVVDPTRDVESFIQYASDNDLRITHIVETHVHADFVSGSRELKARLNDEPQIHVSGMGGAEWTPPYADHVAADGHQMRVGSIRLEAVHTPGHTPEHVSWALYDETRSSDTAWLLFTGDFLFVGDVGRPDLLGAEAQRELAHQLYQTVFERLPAMPDITEIFPAHGAGSLCGKAIGSRRSSTVGFERQFNPALVPKSEQLWIGDLMRSMPLAPPYFRRMKQVNAEGPPIIGTQLPGSRRFSPQQVHGGACDDCLLLDVRSKESFAAAHLPGAINIPLADNLPTWAGWMLPYDRPLLVVADNPALMPQVATHLLRVGFDDLHGYLHGGIDAWENSGLPLATLDTVSVERLHERLRSDRNGLTVLDVRSASEWDSGHINGARHIHLGKLAEQLEEIPRDKPVVVLCGSGYRGSIAASLLMSRGYENVSNVLGGMTAWNALGLPVVSA